MATAAILALGVATPATVPAHAQQPSDRRGDNVVIRWNNAGLDAVINSHLGPPMVARALAILHTCIYDAWAAYDRRAAGTQLGTELRQPPRERTPRNKDEAISFAAYTAAVDIWPELRPRFDTLMAELGYSKPRSKRAKAVGVRACRAVLGYRHTDGSNQLGDLAEGAYSDYTNYAPVNKPMRVDQPLDLRTVKNPNRWQPLIYVDQNGDQKTQAYMGPHMGNVTPFAMTSWDQFKMPPPARFGSREYVKQARALVDYAANLTDRQKVITEYWADEGPGFVSPPGTWSRISQFVSRRDRHNVDQDAKMFFAVNNAIFDASTATWGMKRHYDYVRPITAIRYLYHGKKILSWPEAGRPPKRIDGAEWWPYQPIFFATPAFAEYVSGHSAFGAAAAQALKSFTGSDRYGDSATVRAGSSRVEPGLSPRRDITLSWRTFTEAAAENGISREYGGLHFRDGVASGLSLGRKAGAAVFFKSTLLFAGVEVPPINAAQP
ncbi:vanadium-dependent haloperoxidase [Actinomadura alba]|uniref:Phosphatase PAP2 family protein n=1 Tax=Actinomadura alba TaxID=406431 RepID=A0ABR7LRM1_9ACTN|nr:vanadium-dependent haloperoxidase [Actinomadura alba]MBC6467400.1 phosphatase PAP2 family protein [Actinomadura alba]